MSPALESQPKERELRYQNVPSAKAEEGVIRLLLLDGDFFAQTGALKAEDFSSPTLGKIFSLLCSRHQRGQPCSAAALAGDLTPQEMSLLAQIQEQPESVANGARAMADYINAIRRQRGAGDDDALMKFRNSKLSNGGTSE